MDGTRSTTFSRPFPSLTAVSHPARRSLRLTYGDAEGPQAPAGQRSRDGDTFERSGAAAIGPASEPADAAVDPAEPRHELIARVRREIAAGHYITTNRLDAAIDALIEKLCEDLHIDDGE